MSVAIAHANHEPKIQIDPLHTSSNCLRKKVLQWFVNEL